MCSGVLTILGDVLLKPVIEAAGKDISHWFDKKTKDVCGCSSYLIFSLPKPVY